MDRRASQPSSRGLVVGFVLVAAVVSLGLAAASASASQHRGIVPDMMIDTDSAHPEERFEAFDAVTIATTDLDGDGVEEIIAHNDNNNAYVFDGASGELLGELETNHPSGWNVRELAGPAVGDLTGNGLKDIVLANSAAWVTAFEAQPTDDHRQITFVKLWETHLDPNDQDPDRDWKTPGLDGPPFLADSDGDGRDEVFVQLDDQVSVYKLGSDGDVEAWTDHSDGNAGPLVADITADGDLEAVYPSDGGRLTIYDARSMNWHCGFDASARDDVWPGSISVSPTLADVTSDGRLEIVFGVRNVQEEQYEGWAEDSHAHYFAVDADCNVVWHRSWDWSNPHVHMHPAPVDITGDGSLDVVFQDWNTVGHKPGDWQHTGPSNLFAVEGDTGDLLWRSELPNYWSNKNIAVGDVAADGRIDILANEVLDGDGIALYSTDGPRKGFVSSPDGWVVSKGPTISDLDGDGAREIILPVHRDTDGCDRNLDVGCREGALQIYQTQSHAEAIYPNDHLLNAEDQGAPDPDAGGGTPPDTGGEFQASFESVKGNEWWVETDVQASQSVESVHARVDAGSWTQLSRTDWGTWAKSFHVPEGSTVQLQARNGAGDSVLSDCYAWPEASTTSCPGGGSGSDEVDASFPTVKGNEWWVETDVASDRSLDSVHARLDGGSWTQLSPTDWGTWAKSFHVPEGSTVQFLARASDSAEATSNCYEWTQATQTTCPDGSGSGDGGSGSGSFSASFENVRGNEWWVETDVASEASLDRVEARIDGGSWTQLSRTDWGSWATNVHAPEGASVDFRATSSSGATATSDTYTWPPG